MKDIIRLLSDTVANQIAAGEVIQRPASVVKELLENAIDSGATRIQLVVKDAGRTLIQVIDNGKGMSFNDARLCFDRHATSKLRTADDLFTLTTKGFRGEALASIAAIAHVELKTRQPGEPMGTSVYVEGAAVRTHEPAATPEGTSVAVRNIFYNVPARRNFLKSDNVEMMHIEEELYRIALIHHDIRFTCHVNGSLRFQWEAANFRQRIVSIFGNAFKDKLFPVEESTDFMNITGFIAKPENAKKRKSEQYMFLNRRYVRHNLLNYAVESAYKELIPEGYRPAYFIEIDMDPAAVDINVSPTKVEAKLQDERLVYGFLHSAVKKSLGVMSLTPRIDFNRDPRFDIPDCPKGHGLVVPEVPHDPSYNPFRTVPQSARTAAGRPGSWDDFLKGIREQGLSAAVQPAQLESDFGTPPPAIPDFTPENIPATFPFFVSGSRYLFASLAGNVLLVDIVNARERILFDRYREALENTPIHVQQCLFPSTVTLRPAQADLLCTLKNDFKLLGYDLEKMDGTHFAVNGTPDNADPGDLQTTVENVLDTFKANMFLYPSDSRGNMAYSLARQNRSRCRPLTEMAEVQELLRQLWACSCPATSPSRRPIYRYFGAAELSRYFV